MFGVFFPVGWEAFPGGGISVSSGTCEPQGSEQVALANSSYQVSHTSPETSQLCTAALPSTCSFQEPALPGLGKTARKQPSSRTAASFPVTHLPIFLDRSVLRSLWVLNQIQVDFQGPHNNCSQAPHPLLAMQGMPGRGSGGASRNNVHTSYHILHDFPMLSAKWFIPCSSLLQHQEKRKKPSM